jgi:hypothetical protein
VTRDAEGAWALYHELFGWAHKQTEPIALPGGMRLVTCDDPQAAAFGADRVAGSVREAKSRVTHFPPPRYPGGMTMDARGIAVLACVLGACATAKPQGSPDLWRSRLSQAMVEDVPTRQKRDELSRVLLDAVEAGALEGLSLTQVESAFGRGRACAGFQLCQQQGFGADDWYYLIGRATQPSIKQLPVLILGFTTHGYVDRIYTLKTH